MSVLGTINDWTTEGADHGGGVSLWSRTASGMASGTLAHGLEEARQQKCDDFWYTANYPYAISVKMPEGVGTGEDLIFLLPVGPRSISMGRPFRRVVTPTLGGIYTQESGYAPWSLGVVGNFGLAPKYGYDNHRDVLGSPSTGLQAFLDQLGSPKSGPLWTTRMLQLVFDNYAKWKSDPSTGRTCYMMWHNFKNQEHLVVVPNNVQISRSLSSRMTYPFALNFTVVGEGDPIEQPSKGLVTDVVSAISAASGAISAISTLNDDVVNTFSRVMGSVEGIVAGVANIVNNFREWDPAITAGRLSDQWENSVSSMERKWNSMSKDIERSRDAIDKFSKDSGANPFRRGSPITEARKALMDGEDLIDQYMMRFSESGDQLKYETKSSNFNESAMSYDPSSGRSTSSGTFNRGLPADFNGVKKVQVTATTSLESLAKFHLGDASKWRIIALANNLRPPYFSTTGAPNTLKPGDRINIPIRSNSNQTNVMSSSQGQSEEMLWGTDIALKESTQSSPGRPLVDLYVDKKSGKDIALTSGRNNLVQAIQMRVWTDIKSLPMFPRYGLPKMVGINFPWYEAQAMQLSVRRALQEDSRLVNIGQMTLKTDQDTLEIDVTVYPTGKSDGLTIPTSVT